MSFRYPSIVMFALGSINGCADGVVADACVGGDDAHATSWLQAGLNLQQPTAEANEFSLSHKHQLQRNRSMIVAAVCNVMTPLYMHANTILDQELTEAPCRTIENFYDWYALDFVKNPKQVNVTNGPMMFVPIWKNAHMEIECNFQNGRETQAAAVLEDSQASTFSFVREPLPRLSSGYSEIEFRIKRDVAPSHVLVDGPRAGVYVSRMYQNATPETFWQYPEGSPERASAFIKDIVAVRYDPSFIELWHVFSQTGPLRNYAFKTDRDVDYVGRIERLHEPGAGWDRISLMAGEPMPWEDGCSPPHSQTDESSGSDARAAMDELLEQNGPEVTAMICAVYLPDEVCLGYAVPSDECVAAGFAKDRQAWEEVLRQIRETLCPDVGVIEDRN